MRQEHRQELALKHQRIGAYEVHHYEERLKSALAELDEDSTIISTNKELIRSYFKYRASRTTYTPHKEYFAGLFGEKDLATLRAGPFAC